MTTEEALAEIEDVASRSPAGDLQEAIEVIRAELKRGRDEPDPSLSDAYLNIIRLTSDLSDAKSANIREQQARANSYLEICRLETELARVTAERDRLIEAWPSVGELGVWQMSDGRWAVRGRIDGGHPNREAAVRAAAGLDAKEGA